MGGRRQGRCLTGSGLALLLFCFLTGCTSLRQSGELATKVTEGSTGQEYSTPAIEADASNDSAAPTRSPFLLEPKSVPFLAASKPTQWNKVLDSLSTVLQPGKGKGDAKLLVPDPTEPPSPHGSVINATSEPTPPFQAEGFPDLSPPVAQGEAVPAPDGFEPITMNLTNADVHLAFEVLRKNAPVNIAISEGVSGSVTLNLKEVSFDEALNVILRLCDLVSDRKGNTISIYSAKDFPQLDQVLDVIPLDYASADEVLPAVKGLNSEAGNAYVVKTDSKNNRKTQESIIVEDAPDRVLRIRRYIQQIDIPPRQVLIEAYILDVKLKDEFKHGVNFDAAIKIAGNVANIKTVGLADSKATPSFFTNIDGKNFDALLEALKETYDAKTVAAPKVLVLNGQESIIQIGQRLGYQTTTNTETASMQNIEFLEVGVVLRVTPRISANGEIIMKVNPELSDGRITVDGLPEEETTRVDTNVIVKDGQGIVLGGLIKDLDTDDQKKVPILGNLPYAGLLFQQRATKKERHEVIIALIPRIVPFAPCVDARERLETIRATTPIFHGPLRRCPRPWEPKLKDALPRHGELL